MAFVGAGNERPLLACNAKAIRTENRPRYNDLVRKLRSAIGARRELANGYWLRLRAEGITLAEVGEWIGMERVCCPFLTFRLDVASDSRSWDLALSGPSGTKAILNAAFSQER